MMSDDRIALPFAAALIAVLTTTVVALPLPRRAFSIVGFESTSGSNLLDGGDVITIALVLENKTKERIHALGLGVIGCDLGDPGQRFDAPLRFEGGTSPSAIFAAGVFTGVPVNGLEAVRPSVEKGARIRSGSNAT